MIEIPDKLKGFGIRFILVKKNDKIPVEKDWQINNNYHEKDTKINEHLKNGGNYGILCGNGIIVIDADTKKLNDVVLKELPKTFTVKTGKGFHYYFFCPGFTQKKVLSIENEHLGEIQSNRTFVVGPNSIHPSGKKYSIFNDLNVSDISINKINDIFGKYYSAEKINKDIIINGVSSGLRNDAMFKLACSFKSKGLNINEVTEVINQLNKNNTPPLNQSEINSLIRSAFSYKEIQKNKMESSIKKMSTFADPYYLALEYYKIQPFFFDSYDIWWLWDFDNNLYYQVDQIDLFNSLDSYFNETNTVKTNFKNELLESLKRVGRKNKPKNAPSKWIQFKDKAFSLSSGKIYNVTPDYFFTNPIPWELGKSDETPVMDGLFKEWIYKKNVQDESYVETLYEIISYCCLSDYPLHRIFAFVGAGLNGKGTFLNLLEKFCGYQNGTSTELDLLSDNRFETFKLYKKNFVIMGETNVSSLRKTSILKKLSGGDTIGIERKGHDPFDAKNTAKLLVASNSMPVTLDRTDGFYRRWFIIKFPNRFSEKKDILSEIPEIEYNNLAVKVCKILKKLLSVRAFTNEGSIEDRANAYEHNSNPLIPFLNEKYNKDIDGEIPLYEIYDEFKIYLKKMGYNRVSKRELKERLIEEGYVVEKLSKKFNGETKTWVWVSGLSYKSNPSNPSNLINNLGYPLRDESETHITRITEITSKHIKSDKLNLPCKICKEYPAYETDKGLLCINCVHAEFPDEEKIE